MLQLFLLVGLLSCLFQRAQSAAIHSRATNDDPCAQAAYAYTNEEELDAEIAYQCLRSVPLYKQPALDLLDSLKGFLEIQSTLDYLISPPPGYLHPGLNLLNSIDSIYTRVENNGYTNEYDFQIDLSLLSRLVKDDHFFVDGDLLSIFSFVRPTGSLISLSEDGIEFPSVYLFDDRYELDDSSIPRLRSTGNYSAILYINSIDVNKFLELDSLTSTSQDPDALYNCEFQPSYDIFQYPALYPGAGTNVVFANKTAIHYPTTVTINKDLTNITSGADIYDQFLVGSTDSSEVSASSRAFAKLGKRSELAANPTPDVHDESGDVQGFWDGDIEGDVAVLHLLGFGPDTDETEASFQEAVKEVLQQSTQAGKDKLIIDLRHNGGGTVFLALDTLVQLFPDTNPETRSNMRASAVMYAMMKNSSDLVTIDQQANRSTGLDEVEVESEYWNSPFAWQTAWTPSGKPFKDFEEFYGPYESGPGKFSAFLQENYTNNDRTILDPSAFDITNANPEAKRPFAAENVVILTDGTCASSCSILCENLKNKLGIMSIALGGRPQKGPMQTVGGVKGSRVYDSNFLASWPDTYQAEVALDKSIADPIFDSWTGSAVNRFKFSVNGMNAYRMGDETETPIHFVYEAADCRIWYTPEMLEDQAILWNRVAEIAFTNRKDNVMSSEYCVQDSTQHPTSISGGLKQGEIGPQEPPKEAFPRYTGWIVDGDTVTDDFLPTHDKFGPGTLDANGVVLESSGSPSTSEGLIDQTALKDFRNFCTDHSRDSWLVTLMCTAVG